MQLKTEIYFAYQFVHISKRKKIRVHESVSFSPNTVERENKGKAKIAITSDVRTRPEQ